MMDTLTRAEQQLGSTHLHDRKLRLEPGMLGLELIDPDLDFIAEGPVAAQQARRVVHKHEKREADM
jgi:hypothetical protein